jgi:hypothetical protein
MWCVAMTVLVDPAPVRTLAGNTSAHGVAPV